MDDALVQRWRAGDSTANTAVRNGIRSIAERVLSHPALRTAAGPNHRQRLAKADLRRELTTQIAADVMKRGGKTGSQLTAMTLMIAGRMAVEAMQEGRATTGDAHLPPQVVVTFAIAPAGLNPRVREAAERHLSGCSQCAEDVRIIDNIVRTQSAVDPTAGPADWANELGNESEGDGDGSHDGAIEQATKDLFDELAGKRKATAGRQDPSGGRRATGARPRPTQRPATTASGGGRGKLAAAIPLVLAVGVLVWMIQKRDGPGQASSYTGLPEIADRNPPSVGDEGSLPELAQYAARDLDAGDCRTAAGRFRSARKKEPSQARLYALEGASWVCAGDGRKAQEAMDALARLPEAEPARAAWVRAQAALLQNDGPGALAALEQVVLNDPARRDAAQTQQDRIRAAAR